MNIAAIVLLQAVDLQTNVQYVHKTDYESAIREINAITTEHSRLDSLISQAEQFFELSDKVDRSPVDDIRLTMCRRTILDNGIQTRADLDRLKQTKAEQDNKIAALKKTFESCKKQYEVYSDIAATYHDIADGDYISKLIVAEKEKQKAEQEKKDEQIKKKTKPKL